MLYINHSCKYIEINFNMKISFPHAYQLRKLTNMSLNKIKFHKSLYAEMGKLGRGVQICGCTRGGP